MKYLNFLVITRSHLTPTTRTICSLGELTVRASDGEIFISKFPFPGVEMCEIITPMFVNENVVLHYYNITKNTQKMVKGGTVL